jgi:putative intracellular protease/amidase
MPEPVLVVVSAADSVLLADGSLHPAGYMPLELTAVVGVLGAAGHEPRVVTPAGRIPSPDPRSRPEEVEEAARIPGVGAPGSLPGIEDVTPFAAVVLIGGRGALSDLPRDPQLGRVLREALEGGVPVAALGHGVAGLLTADQTLEGAWPFAGARLTCVSDEEEGDLAGRLSFSLEENLREAGATVELGPAFAPHVVVDRLLVTGQNPASAGPAAEALAGLLRSR